MKLMVVKVKAGQAELRERIKDALVKKAVRAKTLIRRLAGDEEIVWKPGELDEVALELRHLAYQIRTLKMAKAATEEI